jgi:protein gp37
MNIDVSKGLEIKQGKYWHCGLNPFGAIRCKCEVGNNCWSHRMITRFPKSWINGWFPDMQWMGDIAWQDTDNEQNTTYEPYIVEVFRNLMTCNEMRMVKHLGPHIFLFLTKWPERLWHVIDRQLDSYFKDGIWIGTSVTGVNPELDMRRVRALAKFDGFKKWLSIEPLLAGITPLFQYLSSLSLLFDPNKPDGIVRPGWINQVIVGAETGNNAAKCHPNWIRSVVWECGMQKIPVFVKQVNAKRERLLDGKYHNELAWVK